MVWSQAFRGCEKLHLLALVVPPSQQAHDLLKRAEEPVVDQCNRGRCAIEAMEAGARRLCHNAEPLLPYVGAWVPCTPHPSPHPCRTPFAPPTSLFRKEGSGFVPCDDF